MKIVARVLQAVGLLAILAAGAAIVILFELDFLVGDWFVPIVIAIVGGIAVGVVLIMISAVVSPGSAKISFFRASRPGDPIDAELEDKP